MLHDAARMRRESRAYVAREVARILGSHPPGLIIDRPFYPVGLFSEVLGMEYVAIDR